MKMSDKGNMKIISDIYSCQCQIRQQKLGESVERMGSKGGVVTGSRMEGTVTR